LENAIHFISGLPRSGSTLLAAILRGVFSGYYHDADPVTVTLRESGRVKA
jgi:hypothetical protein